MLLLDNQPTNQSSTLHGDDSTYGPARAVDGDNNTFSQTDVELTGSPVWWEVDLGGNFEVDSVVIINKGCENQDDPQECLCNLTGAQIFLFDTSGNITASLHSIGDTCDKPELWFDFRCHSIAEVGDNGQPNGTFPLPACQGDRDLDSDCADGLSCFQRDKDYVPSCDGSPAWDWDYCINRPANYLWYVGNNGAEGLLGKCEGDW
jgi:hypothetical protein